eukprot:5929100-Prymnesium_polylepis.1
MKWRTHEFCTTPLDTRRYPRPSPALNRRHCTAADAFPHCTTETHRTASLRTIRGKAAPPTVPMVAEAAAARAVQTAMVVPDETVSEEAVAQEMVPM